MEARSIVLRGRKGEKGRNGRGEGGRPPPLDRGACSAGGHGQLCDLAADIYYD